MINKNKSQHAMQQQNQAALFVKTLPLKYKIRWCLLQNRVIGELFFFVTQCIAWVKYSTNAKC